MPGSNLNKFKIFLSILSVTYWNFLMVLPYGFTTYINISADISKIIGYKEGYRPQYRVNKNIILSEDKHHIFFSKIFIYKIVIFTFHLFPGLVL